MRRDSYRSPVPQGADPVVMVEYTKLEGQTVKIGREASPRDNIAPEVEDIKKDEVVVKGGEVLSPGKLGAAAALGYASLEVYAKPRVAIYSTGNEITPQGEPLKPGRIYDINSYTLNGIIKANGCEPVKMGVVKDDREALIDAVSSRTRSCRRTMRRGAWRRSRSSRTAT